MQFQERYDFLKTAIARYDGYYNLAAVKASLLLTSNAVLLALSWASRHCFAVRQVFRAFTSEPVSRDFLQISFSAGAGVGAAAGCSAAAGARSNKAVASSIT